MKGPIAQNEVNPASTALPDTAVPVSTRHQNIVFFSGLLILISVPVFKTLTHLPPYMGILIGLGIMWIVTEITGGNKEESDRYKLSPSYALRKIDVPSILFFLGILLSIGVLQSTRYFNQRCHLAKQCHWK